MRLLEFEQTAIPDGETLARRVGMSAFHFSRTFAAEIGETSAAYSRRIRLDHSINRMIYDPAPISEVAAAFGYESQAAFTRAFSRQFDASPRLFIAQERARRTAGPAPTLTTPVRVTEHRTIAAVGRRFFGPNLAAHWHTFLADLPPDLASDTRRAGMTYDDERITPSYHQRYDCVILIDDAARAAVIAETVPGLDAIEAPGGLHAETPTRGGVEAMRAGTAGLFGSWLGQHGEYQPEGDPVVHLLAGDPRDPAFDAVATIRLHARGQDAAPNMRPLDRRGRAAGRRLQEMPAKD